MTNVMTCAWNVLCFFGTLESKAYGDFRSSTVYGKLNWCQVPEQEIVNNGNNTQVRPPGPDRSHPDRTDHFWTPQKTPLWGGLICWTSPKNPVWGGLICQTPPKPPVCGGLICGPQVDRDRGPGPGR